jgi:transposase
MGPVTRQVDDLQVIHSILCCASITTHIPVISSALEFLPPYSPDFNPIEATFHDLKAWI